MNLATTSTVIPNVLLENLALFEPREIIILLVLFYRDAVKYKDIESLSGLNETEIKKYIASLMKYAVINLSDQGDYFIGNRIDIEGLKHRATPKATQSKIQLGEFAATDGTKIVVTGWETFMPNVKMVDVQRKIIYLFFKAVGFDVNEPDKYIQNINDWKVSAFKLSQIIGNDTWLISEAVKKLREAKMTVVTPRSIYNTVNSIKVSGAGSVNEVKKPKEEIVTELW